MREHPRNWKDIAVKGLLFAWFIVLALVVIGPLIPRSYLRRSPSKEMLFKIASVEVERLAGAMEHFRLGTSSYPTGDNRTIINALMGTNFMQKTFLFLHPRSLDSNGDYLDPWQSPYEVRVISTNSISVRSAGGNRKFGDEDDIRLDSDKTENQPLNPSSFR